jgi:MFS family permease
LLLFGRLADLYGRKASFLAGAVWLGVFAIGCAFTNSALSGCYLRLDVDDERRFVHRCYRIRCVASVARHGKCSYDSGCCMSLFYFMFCIHDDREFEKIGILAAAFPPSQARSTAFAAFGAGAPMGSCHRDHLFLGIILN